jgi:cation:H+ antiporter
MELMVIGLLAFVAGMALVVWGAERFTDGAIRIAARLALSTFYVGAAVSGLEPENLASGIAAARGGLPQIALGTVIGSTVFLLTGGLGLTLLLVPMDVNVPREGPAAMAISLVLFGAVLYNDGIVSRGEGALLAAAAAALMIWLYRRSPVFQRRAEDEEERDHGARSGLGAAGLLVAGVAVLLIGAELLVYGARSLLTTVRLSETFLGMVVVGMGESVEETARMTAPARRGLPELAWGNVVGTTVVLLAFNLGVIAMISPLTADPLVLRLHAPYLAVCTLLVAGALMTLSRLGRRAGGLLVVMYVGYLALNLAHMWQ